MSNNLKKYEPNTDGFDGYEDRIEGDDDEQRGGVIKGTLIKFTNEALWLRGDGEEMPEGLELVAVDVGRVVQKWADAMPVETIILEPGQKFPDVEEMNEKTPRSEWVEGPDGKERGPWQSQHILYLLDLATMDRFSWPTGTVGGNIAIRELVDKTNWMRRYRGNHVYPLITLGDVFMNTRFGGRQRPFLAIKNWITLGEDKVIAADQPKAIDQTQRETPLAADEYVDERGYVQKKPAADSPAAKVRTVAEPTLEEILDDELPTFNEPVEKKRPVETKPATSAKRPAARSMQPAQRPKAKRA
jgi:hypothetical protein